MNILKAFFREKVVAIDIGNNSIKVVEISTLGNHKRLENYGEIKSSLLSRDPILNTDEQGNLISINLIARSIREILKEAKIKTKKAIFSLPDFLTFAASFEIPPIPEKEIPGAVYYNASKYLTLPVSEVTLDWRIVSDNSNGKSSSIEVFLVAVPNQVVKEYQEISKMAGLELYALEAEVFGIERALVKDNQKTVCLIDMGDKTSTINIIDMGFLKRSYSDNFSGKSLTASLSSALGIQMDEAEKVKNEEGILSEKQEVVKALKISIDRLFEEIRNVSADFLTEEQKQVNEFYLTGGTANMPGLKEYFAKSFKNPVYIPNCFSGFSYNEILEESLKKMSPRFSAAIGVALGILEI